MILFFIVYPDDEKLDAFVRAGSAHDAVELWKGVNQGKWDDDAELTVITVPTDFNGVGVIPWDTIKSEDIEP